MNNKLTFESILGASILVIVTVILFVEIILRYFFNNSLIWGEEVARYLFIWFVYISMSYAIIAKSHIKIDSMVKFIPKNYRLLFSQIGIIIWILFAVVVAYIASVYTINAFEEQRIAIASSVPLWIVYLGIPLGFILSIIRLIIEFIQNVRSHPSSREED
ncbi:TRAP transporter small permease [Oceanobacillus sp. CF4.6]|uniref:TRAP transporter small permease n=1 Tax=Oceanobacillus sp. CF4.6 TaxID=3373080 RepID=UPI003EE599F7